MKYQLADGNIIVATPEYIAGRYPDAVIVEDPAPAPIEPAVTQITMRQARLYLLGAELLEQVDSHVNTLDQAAQIEWSYASIVERDSPVVTVLADHLELEEEAVDYMFREAAKL